MPDDRPRISPEWTQRLLGRAADMARDAQGDPWPYSWRKRALARHVWWLIVVGREGEAHARLVNAAYPCGNPPPPRTGRPDGDVIERV